MKRLKFTVKQFLKEPLWFKILIIATLLVSVVFSSSYFSEHAYFEAVSKLAAAVFFCTYGIKFRRNVKTSVTFFAVGLAAIILSITAIS
ncbi:hypothetical protein [Peribacillus sp. SCS-155]|uniref:hypothetical protein n=1 Tax=Peribacillus sedimenti TaxID=3115297 RepID=UPI0039063DE6